MANICSFTGKLVGKKEEVKEVFGYFAEEYSYNLLNFDKIIKKTLELEKEVGLDLQNLTIKAANGLFEFMLELVKLEKYPNASREEIVELYDKYTKDKIKWRSDILPLMKIKKISDSMTPEKVEELRKKEVEKLRKNLDYEKFKEIIKEGLSTKYLPKKPHFWGIYEVDIISKSEKPDEKHSISFSGSCAWSLESALSRDGDYARWKRFYDQEWFKGTCIENVHEKFPELKMEIFSEGEMNDFSEHLVMKKDSLVLETEDYEVCMYNSVEEAKEDGVEITEEELEYPIYKELPSWYYLSENDGSIYKVWEL